MIHDEYTDDALNAMSLNKTIGIGQENHIQSTIYPRGIAKNRDANWMP